MTETHAGLNIVMLCIVGTLDNLQNACTYAITFDVHKQIGECS